LEVVFDLLKIDEENQKIILNKINMIWNKFIKVLVKFLLVLIVYCK
jgi:hypothetical protein